MFDKLSKLGVELLMDILFDFLVGKIMVIL